MALDRIKAGAWSITVRRPYCKQCAICVEFCPKKVFALDAEGYPEVIDARSCTGCLLCELRCPDFAIDVEGGAGSGS